MPPEDTPAWVEAAAALDAGLTTLGLDLPAKARDAALQLLRLLATWNRHYNLTALRAPTDMVAGHLLDSLAVLPHLPARQLLDVGTGAGFPGLPLAIARPQVAHVLLDGNLKKTRFVQHAALTLGLANVEVVRARAEHYRPAAPFSVVVARAFAPLGRLLRTLGHLCAPGGRIYALKGPAAATELADLPPGFRHLDTVPLPALTGGRQRTLLILTRADAD
ncbi:MAG: 16S rRNA (guanine(527)-N(7))-methyltransferase RsmG [Immundisolibacter sp.]